jgi:hypothetical protein
MLDKVRGWREEPRIRDEVWNKALNIQPKEQEGRDLKRGTNKSETGGNWGNGQEK